MMIHVSWLSYCSAQAQMNTTEGLVLNVWKRIFPKDKTLTKRFKEIYDMMTASFQKRHSPYVHISNAVSEKAFFTYNLSTGGMTTDFVVILYFVKTQKTISCTLHVILFIALLFVSPTANSYTQFIILDTQISPLPNTATDNTVTELIVVHDQTFCLRNWPISAHRILTRCVFLKCKSQSKSP